MKPTPNSRICPKCNNEIIYTQVCNCDAAEKAGTWCFKCVHKARRKPQLFVRNCLKCGKEIHHKSSKWCKLAISKGMLCRNCASAIAMKEVNNRPEVKKKRSEYCKKHYKGEGNPFYGKLHTEETKNLIKTLITGRKHTKDAKLKSARPGKLNGMYNKSIYSVWLEKYGKEEADKKMLELSRKRSEQCSGSGNPMFGKPPPVGTGVGWSGWYKGWYFRSLTELAYAIHLDLNDIEWVGAESIAAPYIGLNGEKRTCRADFFIQSSKLVEIKTFGRKLNSDFKKKYEAIERFCKEMGWAYELCIFRPVQWKDLIPLVNCGKVKLLPKWSLRLEKIKCKLEKNAR